MAQRSACLPLLSRIEMAHTPARRERLCRRLGMGRTGGTGEKAVVDLPSPDFLQFLKYPNEPHKLFFRNETNLYESPLAYGLRAEGSAVGELLDKSGVCLFTKGRSYLQRCPLIDAYTCIPYHSYSVPKERNDRAWSFAKRGH